MEELRTEHGLHVVDGRFLEPKYMGRCLKEDMNSVPRNGIRKSSIFHVLSTSDNINEQNCF